ncbi:MAG: S8 family serine peptidase [Blastocatellia bacterium]
MSDLPPIITAEAAVKSKRPGFASIFDPQTDVTRIQDIKQFYADPQLMKEAVTELKKAGFRVLDSDRISLTISGPVELFEQQFNVAIISTEQGLTCEGVAQIGYINTDESAFSGVLAGIALPRNAILNGATPPTKKAWPQLYPWEVPFRLGGENFSPKVLQRFVLTSHVRNRQIRVAVIDTGFHQNHPYFTENNKEQLGNVKLDIFRGSTDEFVLQLKQRIQKIYLLLEKAGDIKNLALSSSESIDSLNQRRDELTNELLASLKEYLSKADQAILENKPKLVDLVQFMERKKATYIDLLSREKLAKTKPDYNGHGTLVTSLLLAFIKNTGAALDVCKATTRSLENSFFTALARKPDIVTCSMGAAVSQSVTTDEYLKTGPIIYRKYHQTIQEAAAEGRAIIFATGNLGEARENLRVMEPQWPFVIAVGGAHRGDVATEVIASDIAQGYALPNRYVPDVCGLAGPEGKDLHVLPNPDDDWEDADGSSLAAPQIAGICVFIKLIYPAADWQEMKYILTSSCDEITGGKSADGVDLSRLKTSFPDGTVKGIGLANLERALYLAVSRAAGAAKEHSRKANTKQ